jgi:quercetin dioxygenase-like cupin family protein
MKTRLLLVLLVLLLSAGTLPAAARSVQARCTFAHGFAALAARIPTAVGQCTDGERFDPATGLTTQHTTRGTFTWNKGFNETRFTDTTHTWILGAHGLHERLNTALFPWEQTKIAGASSAGTLAAPPPGPLAISYLAIPHPAGRLLTLTKQAGFVYLSAGTLRIAQGQAPPTTLAAGQAAFLDPTLSYALTNPGPTTAHWDLVAVRAAASSAPVVVAGQSTLYATPRLPTLGAGAYSLVLVSVVIQAGGRGAAHEHSGIEALYMLQGPVKVLLGGQPAMVVPTGQGMYHLPHTPVQEINAGRGIAHELAFIVTPATQPFRRNLDFTP